MDWTYRPSSTWNGMVVWCLRLVWALNQHLHTERKQNWYQDNFISSRHFMYTHFCAVYVDYYRKITGPNPDPTVKWSLFTSDRLHFFQASKHLFQDPRSWSYGFLRGQGQVGCPSKKLVRYNWIKRPGEGSDSCLSCMQDFPHMISCGKNKKNMRRMQLNAVIINLH